MTIETELRTAGPFVGNGVTTTFDFDFKIFTSADIQVDVTVIATGAITTLVLNTDYTVSVNADQNTDPGGTVTYNPSGTPMASTKTLTISSVVDDLQETDITNAGGFYPNVIEDMVDRVTIGVLQLKEKLARALRGPVVDDDPLNDLPTAEVRASKYLAFDADGQPIATAGSPPADVIVSPFMETVLDDTTAAAARTTLGAAASGLATASGLTLNTARLLGRATAGTGAVEELAPVNPLRLNTSGFQLYDGVSRLFQNVNLNASVDAGTGVMTVSLKTYEDQDPGTGPLSIIYFRSIADETGPAIQKQVGSAVTLTIPNGATLGTTNGVKSRLWIAAVYRSAGTTPILAVYNAQSGVSDIPFVEDAIVSGSAIGTGSDSAGTWYGSASFTNKPIVILGYIESTQGVAGVWDTAPALVVTNTLKRPGRLIKVRGPDVPFNSAAVLTLASGLPARIVNAKVVFNGLSSSGTSPWLLQLAIGGIVISASYVSLVSPVAGSVASGSSTAGFILQDAATAADAYNGEARISRSASGYICSSSLSGTQSYIQNGKYASTSEISGLSLTTAGGADTFDAGNVHVEYEYYD